MSRQKQELLRLCADRPRTARELVKVTGELRSTTSSRLHSLVQIGALKKTRPNTGKVFVYQTATNWRDPVPQDVWPKEYKPLGICVMGVWM